MIGLPIFSFRHLRKNFNRLIGFENEFDAAFGTLYQSMDPLKTAVYQMTTIFCVRRLMVSFITVYFESPLVVPIYINIYSSLWIIKFYFNKMPMLTRSLNKIELLNEIFQLFSNYFMFLFTEFIGDMEARYEIGYAFIGYVSFVFVVNL